MASDRHSKEKPRNIRASRKKGRPSRIFATSSPPSAVRFSLMAKSATTLLHNCAAFAPASDRHATRSRSHSKAFFAPAASPPVRTTSHCETIVSSFRFAPATAALFQASCTLPAPRAKRYSSSRSKPSISIIASSNFPKKKSLRLHAFSPNSPNKSAPIAGRLNPPPRESHLDSVFARARFAREFDCTMPEFSIGNSLRLEAARNPVLEHTLRPQGRKAVPLTLALGGSETVMVISGPNTGGKTVALKNVGLAALAAQSAIPVAAERAELPLFDHVLADIGDEQSIAADLSTFSAHMLNLKSMLEIVTDRSLILVDEMGTGTAPEEGAALAVALLEEFRALRALTIATTHHDRLKAYASTTPGIVNAAMEFDEENLRPTYRLLVGVPGTSSGLEIARRLGLPSRVVDHARASLSPESREARDLIAYLHRSRDEMDEIKRQAREELMQLEAERRSLQTEWVERQKKRIAELEKNFDATQKHLEAEIARLAADIKDR